MVTSVTGPTEANVNQTVTIEWTIVNIGSGTAIGPWHDTVRLEVGGETILVGEVVVGDGVTLGPGETYAAWSQLAVPATPLGKHAWQVTTNTKNDIFEGRNYANNTATSIAPVTIQIPQLTLGQPVAAALDLPGDAEYFLLRVETYDNVVLTLDDVDDAGWNELYVRHGSLPTVSEYDVRHEVNPAADHRIEIDAPQPGDWYVMVVGREVDPAPSEFTLTAALAEFEVYEVTPDRGGNTGSTTVCIHGSGLHDGSQVFLVDDEGGRIYAWPTRWEDDAHLYATFQLDDYPREQYDVVVQRPNDTEFRKVDAFEILPGIGPRLEARVISPESARLGRATSFTVEYANTGDADMPSPLLEFSVHRGLELYLSPDLTQKVGVGTVEFVGYSSTGPAGVLQPGDREQITFYTRATVQAGQYPVSLQAVTPWDESVTEPIDWQTLKENTRPPFVTDLIEWNAIIDVFRLDMGSTWGEILERIAGQVTEHGVAPGTLPYVSDYLTDALADATSRGGGLADQWAPFVTDHEVVESPGGGVAAIKVVFSETIDSETLTEDNVHFYGVEEDPSLTVTRLSDRVYKIAFPTQTTAGTYKLTLENATDLAGNTLVRDSWPFAIDEEGRLTLGPLSFTFGFGDAVDLQFNPYLSELDTSHLTIQFNRIINEETFSTSDIDIEYSTDPDSRDMFYATGVTRISGSRFRVDFHPPANKDTRNQIYQQLSGPFWVAIGPGVEDLDGIAVGSSPEYSTHLWDNIAPLVDKAWIPVHPGSWWEDYIAPLFDYIPDYIEDAHAVPMGSALPGPVDRIYVQFSEPVWGFDEQQVSIVGPDGPVEILHVRNVTPAPMYIPFAYTIHFEKQTTGGEYLVRVGGPDVVDRPCYGPNEPNPMERAYEGSFRILPDQVVVLGSINDPFHVKSSQRPFPRWSHYAVSLWEVVGQRDSIPGQSEGGDEPDYVVSVLNELSQGKYATKSVAFLHDLNGELILNADPREDDSPRELYVVVYAENEYGAVVDAATITTTSHDGDPTWAPIHPTPLPSHVEQEWALTRIAGMSNTVSMPDDGSGGYATVDITLSSEQFLPFLRWLELGEWFVKNERLPGLKPRGWTAMKPVHDAYGEHSHNPEHDLLEVVIIPRDTLKDPLSFWHAYAHALQFAANDYHPLPYDPKDAGAIWESDSVVSAYVEGSASGFSAVMAKPYLNFWGSMLDDNAYSIDFVVTARSRYRQEEYLERNDFWMGFDGYGLENNREASDVFIDPEKLDFDGVNNNANTGEDVAGAIASIVYAMSDVSWPISANPLSPLEFQSLADYAAAVVDLDRGREPERILIDHGVPVTDDRYEPNDLWINAKPFTSGAVMGQVVLPGLIMAEEGKGFGDWFSFTLPKTTEAVHDETYRANIRVRFDAAYGDLDLVVCDSGGVVLKTAVERGGSYALVHLKDLHTSHEYNLLAGVFGHGAVKEDGTRNNAGGDFHPDYSLQVVATPPTAPYSPYFHQWFSVISSHDPNIKIGPAGEGESGYVADGRTLPYTVFFENDPQQATAPAQEVVVTDQLSADLDWSTFQFGQICFGEQAVPVPEGRLHYETDVSVPCDSYPVHVTADFNPQTGLVTWTMESFDPLTGLLPEDPFAGFLPPNDDDHRGEGFVTFTVEPKAGLPTGTEIVNSANIVFDVNSPIATDEVINTIDAEAPTSHVDPLPAEVDAPTFDVSWSGTDDGGGSGIAHYDIYSSDNGGPWQLWLDDTTETTGSFTGAAGHTFGFYSIATDNVGHRELPPSSPDAQTTLTASAMVSGLEMSLVRQPTATTAEDEVATLPESEEWIDEWDAFRVEIWVHTPGSDDVGVAGVSVDLMYNTDYFTATMIEYGGAFSEDQAGSIDDSLGLIEGLGGSTPLTDVGDDQYALLARVSFAAVAGDPGVGIGADGRNISPVENGFSLSNAQVTLQGDVPAEVQLGEPPDTELWPVMYDIDDNGCVGLGDLAYVASAYGKPVDVASPGFVWASNFDRSGEVGLNDLAYFASNYGRCYSVDDIAFPPNFPDAWRVGGSEGTAPLGLYGAGRYAPAGEEPAVAVADAEVRPGSRQHSREKFFDILGCRNPSRYHRSSAFPTTSSRAANDEVIKDTARILWKDRVARACELARLQELYSSRGSDGQEENREAKAVDALMGAFRLNPHLGGLFL